MEGLAEIGARVRESMTSRAQGMSQAKFAQQLGMTADAFSRALNGRRAFSAIELAKVAELLGADLHWLITGEPDPQSAVFAARHQYDFDTGERHVPGRQSDEETLEIVALAYRQAGSIQPSARVPAEPSTVRKELGLDFIRPFADRVESELGVDIIRVAELSTAYCFSIAGRHAIVLPAVGNWFRENWDIAHELGHLAAGHLACARATPQQEAAANAFAAELLLPERELRAVSWASLSETELASEVWARGISTDALVRRLSSLRIDLGPALGKWAGHPTQRLLRYHWIDPNPDPWADSITERMSNATIRRFPNWLESAHLKRITAGELGRETLAWMLGVPADQLEVEEPPSADDFTADELASLLGHTAS